MRRSRRVTQEAHTDESHGRMISRSFGPITPARSTRHASRRRVAGYPSHVRARQDARRLGTGINEEREFHEFGPTPSLGLRPPARCQGTKPESRSRRLHAKASSSPSVNLCIRIRQPSIDVPFEHIIRGPALNIPCCAGAFVLSRKVPEVLLHPEAERTSLSDLLPRPRAMYPLILSFSFTTFHYPVPSTLAVPSSPTRQSPIARPFRPTIVLETKFSVKSESTDNAHRDPTILSPSTRITQVSIVTRSTINNFISKGRLAISMSPTTTPSKLPRVDEILPRQEVAEWLNAPQFQAIHDDALSLRTDGTGTWFIDSTEFKCYIQEKGCVVWCTGKPGSGKSILASTSIEYLQGTLTSNGRKASDIRLFAAIDLIAPSYLKRKASKTGCTAKEVVGILGEIVRCLDQVYAVIDGLDEASDEVKVEVLCKLPPTGMNILIFSRPLDLYTDYTPKALQVLIEARTEDIDLYVSEQCDQNPALRALCKEHPELEEELRRRLKKQADGMFLLARLQLEASMPYAINVDSLFTSLETMPSGLEEMYSITLQRIHNQIPESASIAYRLFAWLLFHFPGKRLRNFTTKEVTQMLAVSIGRRTWKKTNITPIETILSLCHGLVTISYGEIRFVHYTTAEYLREALEPTISDAHGLLAATCVLYLEHRIDFSQHKQGKCSFDSQDQFLVYALENWGKHSGGALWTEGAHFEIVRNSLSRAPFYPVLQGVRRDWDGALDMESCIGWTPSLSLAAMHGCISIIKTGSLGFPPLLSGQLEDDSLITPFHAAACNGNFDAFLSLVAVYGNQGLCFWSSNDSALPSILHSAAKSGDAGSFLKELFAFVDSPPTEGIDLDLSNLDVNAQDSEGRTALILACRTLGGDAAAMLISRRDIQINIQCRYGMNALMEACCRSLEDIASLLLAQEGIQVNLQDTGGKTALMYACSQGCEGIIRLLMAHPDIQAYLQDRAGLNAFYYALRHTSRSISTETLDLFLSSSPPLDLETTDYQGDTGFTVACINGYHHVVNHALNHRPDDRVRLVTHTNAKGMTALMGVVSNYWFEESHRTILDLLLKHGADINVKELTNGWTPLFSAVAKCDPYCDIRTSSSGKRVLECVSTLLELNPSAVAQRDNSGRTALMLAALRRSPELTGFLLSRTKSICLPHAQFLNAQDINGHSAFLYAVMGSSHGNRNLPVYGLLHRIEGSSLFATLYSLLDGVGGWNATHIRMAVIAGVRHFKEDISIYRLLLEDWVRYSFEWNPDDTNTVVLLAAAVLRKSRCGLAVSIIIYYMGLLEPSLLPGGVGTLEHEKIVSALCREDGCEYCQYWLKPMPSREKDGFRFMDHFFKGRRSYSLEELQQRIRKPTPHDNEHPTPALTSGIRRAPSGQPDGAFDRLKRARLGDSP
ncbi:hypothetical protein NMY22_g17844 [Coprinellus aureogranulatus]|nr:hypothetical protein NMY22_g17844 [Coprinellus aureogranulatus]